MKNASVYSGKLGLQQRVLPSYRVTFFNHLADACQGGLSVLAGEPRQDESIVSADGIPNAKFVKTRNLHLFRGNFYLCAQTGLLPWLNRWNPDALVLESNFRYPINRLAMTWMHRRGRPVIGWGIGVRKNHGGFSRVLNQMRSNYLSSFDAVIAYSTQGAEECVAVGVPQDKVFIAVNSLSPPIDQIPKRSSWESRVPRILHVGRFQARKRLDLLIRACAALEINPELHIVGAGPEEENLRALAKEIYPTTKFLGFLEGNDLVEAFEQADLFVLPGTGGLAIQEAMVYGLPIIVGEGDGTQRDLVTVENGWHIRPGNFDDLVKALKDGLSDWQRLLRLGETSFQVVRDKANVEKMVEVFVQAMEFATREVS